MSENKSMILTFILSIIILWSFHYVTESKHHEQLAQNAETISQCVNQIAPLKSDQDNLLENLPRTKALVLTQRVPIKTDKLSGSINLTGAQLDDLSLLNYKETTKANSAPVVLFSPKNSTDPYYAQVIWNPKSAMNMPAVKMDFPTENTVWSVIGSSNSVLTPLTPLKLQWTNAQGIIFERVFSIDEKYVITITDTIINHSDMDVEVGADRIIVRNFPPKSKTSTSVHEGGIGYFNDTLKEIRYDKLEKGKVLEGAVSDGWAGFTDKYWLTSFIVKDSIPSQVFIGYTDHTTHCQIKSAPLLIKAGQQAAYKTMLFAGAKVLEYLDEYSVTHGVTKFDLAVDFGWLYFLTKPLFYLLKFCYSFLGNLGLAIIFLTFLSKLLSYPLARTSYRSMARMKDFQPKIELLKQRYGDNKIKVNEEMMKLYKKEKINPMSGCLPMLIQMPIFFCLYKVFTISIEMRQAPFVGWIKDLSAPDPTSVFNLFGLLHWTPPSFLQIGILPLIMGGTMFLQQKLTPQSADPTQAKMMYIMPLIFLFMFSAFPSGLVLYWTMNNILSIIQQLLINKESNKMQKVS